MTTTLKVSKRFLIDFAELANRYKWDSNDIAEVKQATRENPSLVKYWETLAKAHRDGYDQKKENNYIRLSEWLKLNKISLDTN